MVCFPPAFTECVLRMGQRVPLSFVVKLKGDCKEANEARDFGRTSPAGER